MAAKPPKPPRNFLKNLFLNTHLNNNNNNNNNNSNSDNNIDDNIKETEEQSEILNSNTDNLNDNNTVNDNKKSNCNCTNITIMHLFHEMKQEFPTIPDTVVTQCVNENCHQRENCIQMLKNELALNPIPVQSYPAKVLHPSINNINNNNNNNSNGNNNNNLGNKNNNNINSKNNFPKKSSSPPLSSLGSGQKPPLQQRPPLKPPLKPVRPAPVHPPIASAKLLNRIVCGENSSSILSADGLKTEGYNTINETTNDMPSTNTPQIPLQQQQQEQQLNQQPLSLNSIHINGDVVNFTNNNNNNTNNNVVESGNGELKSTSPQLNVNEVNSRPVKPVRPTTLNLNLQQQQKQQRLNVQMQEQLQQQQQQEQKLSKQTTTTTTGKPLRKAPLPPIGPKPIIFHHSNNTNQHHHHPAPPPPPTHHHHLHHHIAGTDVSPQSESEISVNLTLSTPSPTLSSPSSTKSLTTTTSKTHHTSQQKQNLQNNKSPIRHRSVITLQPEPPYTRDFLLCNQQTSTTAVQQQQQQQQQNNNSTTTIQTPTCIVSSPTNSVHSGQSQKSYTSVNLTLRPPTTVLNSALQPSAIDITAGPGFSGASGGGKSLSYSSTSYDARLGYQQNFHITVTDEGGVFSASRRRPQQQQPRNINQQQQQQLKYQQQQQQKNLNQPYYQADKGNQNPQQQQQYNNPYNSPSGIGCSSGFGSMCLAPQQEDDVVTETLERQKKRRDRLAGALRENKKRLSQVEQEVNLITGPIPDGLSERLDIEIQKLRAECDAMLRSSNPLTQLPPQPPSQQKHQQQTPPYQQFSPQPFPRQRSARPPPRPPPNGAATMPPRQSSLDIIQHHNTTTPCSPHTPASLPNYTPHSPTMGQQWPNHSPHHSSLPPSLYQQQQQQQQQQHYPYTDMPDEEPPSYYIDHDVPDYDADDVENVVGDVGHHDDDDDDDEYEVVDPWECSMCTFRNHPQLNICECCDNVRILPGTLTKFSRALKTTASASPSSTVTAAVAGLAPVMMNNAPLVTDVNAAGATASVSGVSTPETNNIDHDSSSASTAAANMAPQQLQHFALHI